MIGYCIKGALVLVALALASCAPAIPPEAPGLSRYVGQGVAGIRQNARSVIDAWEQVALALVDERWAELYSRALDAYRARRSVEGELSAEQHRDVAGLAALMRDGLTRGVRDKAGEMRAQVDENTDVTMKMSNGLTDLLTSARTVIEANEALLGTIKDIVPVPTNLLEVPQQ